MIKYKLLLSMLFFCSFSSSLPMDTLLLMFTGYDDVTQTKSVSSQQTESLAEAPDSKRSQKLSEYLTENNLASNENISMWHGLALSAKFALLCVAAMPDDDSDDS